MGVPFRDGGIAPRSADSPATFAAVVTLGVDLANGVCRSLLCETEGRANLMFVDGSTCADFPLQAGYNPVSVRRVSAPTTGVAPTGPIVALY